MRNILFIACKLGASGRDNARVRAQIARGDALHIGEIELRVTRADRRRVDTLKVIPPRDVLPPEEREVAD